MVDRMGQWLHKLFEEYKFVRRLLVLWAVLLITWTAARVFSDLSQITSAAAAAFASVTALLTVIIGFYQWSRERD